MNKRRRYKAKARRLYKKRRYEHLYFDMAKLARMDIVYIPKYNWYHFMKDM